MVNDFAIGTLLAFGAATLFGAQTSFSKMKTVRDSKVPMPIFNVYFLIGAALVNFIEYFILLGLGWTITFSYLGIICALLLLCFNVFILLSIQQIGVGYATGFSVFSGGVIAPIVQVILGQPIAQIGIMVVGLAMLCLSVFLMSVLRDALKFLGIVPAGNAPIAAAMDAEMSMAQAQYNLDEQTPLVSTSTDPVNLDDAGPAASEPSKCAMVLGLVYSSLAGIFLAVLPLPSLFADPTSAGLAFFLSFGVGCLCVVPLSAIITVATESGAGPDGKTVSAGELMKKLVTFDQTVWRTREVVLPAMSAGVVWGVGNICGFCSFLYLSYTIAVSFVQCNVIVAMLLGILVWKEMSNAVEIGIMFALSVLLVGGCVVVLYGVTGTFG